MYYDIIIIGTGLSGLMAAKTAVDMGKKVLIKHDRCPGKYFEENDDERDLFPVDNRSSRTSLRKSRLKRNG
jgi:UDP-galactopyranose mutase